MTINDTFAFGRQNLQMEKRNSTVYTILRSLKKPTPLDEIIDSVPKPKGAVVNFGLPKWKFLPLDTKIPLVPGPKDAYNFSRQKIGKPLMITSKKAEFDLTDPNNNYIKIPYDSMHDRHLTRYFANEKVLKRMRELDFITKDSDAKCSVGEYNMYRKYLQKIHGESVKKELKRREAMRDEQRGLEIANNEAQKEVLKLKDREKKLEARARILAELHRQSAEKRRQQMIKDHQSNLLLKNLEQTKKEQQERKIMQAKLREENLKRKRRLAAEREREKIIKVLLKWVKKDQERRKKLSLTAREAEDAKRRAIEQKWVERQEHQKLQLTIEEFILEYAAGEAKSNIEKYMKKVDRECEIIKEKIKNRSESLKTDRRESKPKEPSEKSEESLISLAKLPTDDCEMTENCRCDAGSEYCMDLRQLHV